MRTPIEVENAYYADTESAHSAIAGQGPPFIRHLGELGRTRHHVQSDRYALGVLFMVPLGDIVNRPLVIPARKREGPRRTHTATARPTPTGHVDASGAAAPPPSLRRSGERPEPASMTLSCEPITHLRG